jgi:hypothetical protein
MASPSHTAMRWRSAIVTSAEQHVGGLLRTSG